jgi:two-component system response regulator HydG
MNAHAQSILIVEDQASEREAMVRMLRTEGYDVSVASNVSEARAYISKNIDLVITDLRLGKLSGIDLLKQWHESRPTTPILVVTAYGEVDSAVLAMKLGALDYLMKPLKPEQLLVLLNRYLPMRKSDTTSLAPGQGLGKLIGNSSLMLKVFDSILRVSESDSIVLITGESGTGKELVAAAIHDNSPRRNSPYVAINIAALPDALIEAELFGHTRGAFTGATEAREGRFQAANGGSLFMDEIGDFPLSLQPKLLRVLENFSFSPVGSNQEEQVNVRLIAATSRNIPELVERNQFRVDLYHRLNVLNIDLPPLRERPEDIDTLVAHFVKDCARRHLRTAPEVSPELLSFLRGYEWPGNVRQLRNTIENMFVMGGREQLVIQDLPKYLSGSSSTKKLVSASDKLNLSEIERETILGALTQCMGNRTHAAQKLGISIRTLQRKLRQWNIEDEQDWLKDKASHHFDN